jgi:putative Mn2+ efflux pump MntP
MNKISFSEQLSIWGKNFIDNFFYNIFVGYFIGRFIFIPILSWATASNSVDWLPVWARWFVIVTIICIVGAKNIVSATEEKDEQLSVKNKQNKRKINSNGKQNTNLVKK